MSARRGAIASTEEWRWRAYGHLTHSVRTGEPGFRLAHGCGLWEYLAREPDAAAMFNESMSRVAAANAAAIVRTYDFSHVNRLVDVGGGHGILACAVLEANPHMYGVVFDLPGVIDGARTRLTQAGLTDRCEADRRRLLRSGPGRQAMPTCSPGSSTTGTINQRPASLPTVAPGCAMVADCSSSKWSSPPGRHRPPRTSIDWSKHRTWRCSRSSAAGNELPPSIASSTMNAGFELTRILALDSLPWSLIEGV